MNKFYTVTVVCTVHNEKELRDHAMERAFTIAKMTKDEFEQGELEHQPDNIVYWLGWAFDAGTPEGAGFQIVESTVGDE